MVDTILRRETTQINVRFAGRLRSIASGNVTKNKESALLEVESAASMQYFRALPLQRSFDGS